MGYLGITQKSAWFWAYRIRDALDGDLPLFQGPVEADKRQGEEQEPPRRPQGGRQGCGGWAQGSRQRQGRGGSHCNCRSGVVGDLLEQHVSESAAIYSDESTVYSHLLRHESVNHGRDEYVRDKVHAHGIDSVWALLKRGDMGVYTRTETVIPMKADVLMRSSMASVCAVIAWSFGNSIIGVTGTTT